jgi:hypothetical protein
MQRISGLDDAQVTAWEEKLEAQTVASLQAVMDKIARRIEKIQVASAVLVAADGADLTPPEQTGELAIPAPQPVPAIIPPSDLPPGQPYISPDDLATIGPIWQQQVTEQILPLVAQVFIDSAGHIRSQILDAVPSTGVLSVPALGSDAAERYLAQMRNSYDQIGDHLWATARTQLSEGFDAGESIPQLADRLRASAGLSARSAVLVARTSVIEASNFGSLSMARVSGLEMQKEWIATLDLRTRPTHLEADGQRVDLGDPFIVGGHAADFPAAPSLPPSERYRCRCTVGYVMPDRPKELPSPTIDQALPGTSIAPAIEASPAEGEIFPSVAGPSGPDFDLPARGSGAVPASYVRPELKAAKTPRELRRVWQDQAQAFTGFPFYVDRMPHGISMVTAREYAEGLLQMLARFPGARVDRVHWFDDAASASYAQVRRGGHAIEFNMRYASEKGRPAFLAARRRDVAGWDTGRGTSWGVRNDTTGQGVVYHEFIHILDLENTRASIQGKLVPLLIQHAQREGITDIDDMIKRRISTYATENYQEMIAEAGTDVMVNGAAASQLSRDIFDMLHAEYRRRGFEVRVAPALTPDELAQGFGDLFPKVAGPARSFAERLAEARTGYDVEKLAPVRVEVDASAGSDTGKWKAVEAQGFTGAPGGLLAAITRRVRVSGPFNEHLRFPEGRALADWEVKYRAGLSPEFRAKLEALDAEKRVKTVATAERDIKALDRAMAQSPLRDDAVVWRGGPARELGIPDTDAVGYEWVDPAYPGVTGQREIASGFVGANGLLTRILVPRGTPAINIYGGGEGELLLARGLRFRVVADTRTATGVRQLDVEIVQPETPAVAAPALKAPAQMSVAELRAELKTQGVAVPPKARKADLVTQVEQRRAAPVSAAPGVPISTEVQTSLSAAEQARVRTLVQRDPQIFATMQDRFGDHVSTSGNLSNADAAWLDTIYRRDRAFVERAAQDAQIRRTIAAEAKKAGITPTQYREQTSAQLKSILDGKPIAIRVRDEAGLRDILSGGRFKTSLEGAKRGAGLPTSPERRKLGESVMGIPTDAPLAERPVYGYVGIRGIEPALSPGKKIAGIAQREGQEDILSVYGQIQVVLKPEVRARTTVTVGDSLDEIGFIHPTPISNPGAESVSRASQLSDMATEPGWTRRSYVEAQVRSGVRREDIAEIVFAEEPSAATVAALKDSGIPWRILRKGDEPFFPAAPSPVTAIAETSVRARSTVAIDAARGAEAKAVARQTELDVAMRPADLAIRLDELIANGASRKALLHTIDTQGPIGGIFGADLERLRALADDPAALRAAVRQAAAREGLEITGQAGDVVAFDRRIHESIGGAIADGTPVQIIRPGARVHLGDEIVPARRAAVQVTDQPLGPAAAPTLTSKVPPLEPAAPLSRAPLAWQARQDELRAISARPVIKDEQVYGGESAYTRKLEHEGGPPTITKDTMRIHQTKAQAARDADAEELGALTADAVGLRAPTVVRLDRSKIEMEFLEGKPGGGSIAEIPRGTVFEETDDGRLMGLLDYVTGNPDRSDRNWLLLPDGHMASIDMGDAFRAPKLAGTRDNFGSDLIFDEETSKPRKIVDFNPADLAVIRTRLEALRPEFERLKRGTWHNQMMARLADIEKRADPTAVIRLAEARPDLAAVKSAQRAAVRAQAATIATQRANAALLARVDELIQAKATRTVIRQELDPALLEPEQLYAGADPKLVDALRTALDTGDTAKLRAAITRQSKVSAVTPIGKAGARVKFDPATMEGVGGTAIPDGADVIVVRRGARIAGVETPELAQVRLARAPSTAKTVAKGDFGGLTRTSDALGGNPGGIFEAGDGSRWYVKAAEEGQASSEALALDLYRAAGLEAPEAIIGEGVEGLGRRQIATRFLDDAQVDLRARFANDPAYIAEVQDGFAVDAWLGNWDVIGANPAPGRGWDNIISVAGRPVRIDAGGALRYRGLGSDKPFTDDAAEFETMRLKTKTPQGTIRGTGAIFGDMTPEQIIKSAERVRKVTPAKIKALVKKHGWDPELAETLIARRADILRRAEALAGPKPMTPREFAAAIKAAAKGEKALDAAPISAIDESFEALNFDQQTALTNYRGAAAVNEELREAVKFELPMGHRYRADVQRIDEIMDMSRLTQDAVVWRGLRTGRSVFGERDTWNLTDLTGFEWVDPAFSSTTTARSVAERFTDHGGVRMRMLLPKGSKAIQLSQMPDPGIGVMLVDEAELLSARGARFRVVRDNGWTEFTDRFGRKGQVRDLDVEIIVPDETPPLPASD